MAAAAQVPPSPGSGPPVARVSVVPGDGVVSRDQHTVLAALAENPSHDAFVDALLALDAPGEARVREAARLVIDHPSQDIPPFVLLAQSSRGTVALLTGDARLTVTLASGDTLAITGADSLLFHDQLVPADFVQLLLTLPGSSSVPARRSDLAGGVVTGSGALVTSSGSAAQALDLPKESPVEPAPPTLEPQGTPTQETTPDPALLANPAPVAQTTPAASFEAIPLFDVEPEDGSTLETKPAPPRPKADADEVLVEGIECSRGHFNQPGARFCARCGIAMVHQTHALVRGVRPPLGVIVLDDGTVYPLTKNYVLGREPETAEAVVSGAAIPLPMDDAELQMSRIHAWLLLDGWDVRVEDANSSNGTLVRGPNDPDWVRLSPGVPTTITPGSRVSLGGRRLTYESHHKL